MKATREVPGAICSKISNILPMTENSKEENPVMFPPGRARLLTQPVPTGSPPLGNTMGTELVFIISHRNDAATKRKNDIRLQLQKARGVGPNEIHSISRPMLVELDVAAL